MPDNHENRNEQLYQASVEALINYGVPNDLIGTVSAIIAKDNPELPNLGRTEQEQQAINQVLPYLNGVEA